jgi:hypothetical protein
MNPECARPRAQQVPHTDALKFPVGLVARQLLRPGTGALRWLRWLRALFVLAFLLAAICPAGDVEAEGQSATAGTRLQKRWLFVWRDLSDAKEVDRMLTLFPQAKASGYNGVALSYNIATNKAAAVREAAKQNNLDLIAIVMGNPHDRNYVEGVPVKDAVFVVKDGRAQLEPDRTAKLLNADFEDATGNHFKGWTMQDDEGVTTFADNTVFHGGKMALRMENIGKNEHQHCRLAQPVSLRPFRQYRLSFWVKTDQLAPADAEVKMLSDNASSSISFQTFRVAATQDWKHYDVVFNSLDHDRGRLYLGSWSGKNGKLWWDDLTIEEIGLVNVLRRPGCPVTVRGEDGTSFEEGRDYARIVDPILNPWQAYHEPAALKLAQGSRMREGTRLRVSYYHPLIVYEDRLNGCLSEPKIFEEWENEVKRADELLHPSAYFMSHDELRVMNWCASCQNKHMTPGELLAWNVKQATGLIRKVRPDAEIWVWNDMFDPMHNAVDHFYAVNGSLAGSWKGLDKDVGIVNWHGGLKGKNCAFFDGLGLRQILSGYYDSDETGAGIAEWLSNTKDVKGIVGAMYTTWENKYGAMSAWAAKAWGK